MSDKTGVVVTGAAQGLGRAISERFMAGGCHVVGIDIAEKALTAMASQGKSFTAMHGDAGNPEVIAKACRIVSANGAGLRAIVLNAAISIVHPTDEYPLDDWDKVMGVNLRGVFAAAKAARPFMSAGSSVVMLSSIAASHALPGRVAYCTSKAGVDGLMRALAVDWGPYGIRVNAVAPGTFRTEMLTKLINDGKADIDRYISRIPMQRAGESGELANAAFFLASDQASFINGVVLPVDGGWAAAALSNL